VITTNSGVEATQKLKSSLANLVILGHSNVRTRTRRNTEAHYGTALETADHPQQQLHCKDNFLTWATAAYVVKSDLSELKAKTKELLETQTQS
jgi:hypothetical protein